LDLRAADRKAVDAYNFALLRTGEEHEVIVRLRRRRGGFVLGARRADRQSRQGKPENRAPPIASIIPMTACSHA
jgi:hypothetical protein